MKYNNRTKILSHKSVLARILKFCVEEYSACSLEEIEHRYIEGVPKISKTPVHRDEISDGDSDNARSDGCSIRGDRNEDASMTEGTVTYDIIFKALNPLDVNEAIQMIINIEGQGNTYPGYPLVKRGIYYGSRMISSQYGTVFVNSHYEKLQKVYSIWICINPPKYRENTINLYSVKETQLQGNVKEKRENYDLMDVVIVGLTKTEMEKSEGLIRMLSVMFAGNMHVAKKKEILETEFGLAMSRTMEKEVSNMGSYADWFEEEGMKRGIEKGMQLALENLMDSTGMVLEEAMNALKIPEQDRETYAEKLKAQ